VCWWRESMSCESSESFDSQHHKRGHAHNLECRITGRSRHPCPGTSLGDSSGHGARKSTRQGGSAGDSGPPIPVDDIRLEPRRARCASRVVTGGHFACRWPPCSGSGQRGKAAATSERRPHRMPPSTRQPASARCGRPARKDSKSTTGMSSTSWRIPGIRHKVAETANPTSVAQKSLASGGREDSAPAVGL